MQFYQLAPGARFEFKGKAYRKLAMDTAEDAADQVCSFARAWEVSSIGQPLLLFREEAKKWRPIDLDHWADHLTLAPGKTISEKGNTAQPRTTISPS